MLMLGSGSSRPAVRFRLFKRQVFDGNSFLFTALGAGLWPIMVLVSEVVQTLILADFCYYYVLSFAQGGSARRGALFAPHPSCQLPPVAPPLLRPVTPLHASNERDKRDSRD